MPVHASRMAPSRNLGTENANASGRKKTNLGRRLCTWGSPVLPCDFDSGGLRTMCKRFNPTVQLQTMTTATSPSTSDDDRAETAEAPDTRLRIALLSVLLLGPFLILESRS